jgi:hypothetical protein
MAKAEVDAAKAAQAGAATQKIAVDTGNAVLEGERMKFELARDAMGLGERVGVAS